MNRLTPQTTQLSVATNLKDLRLPSNTKADFALPDWSAWGKNGASVSFDFSPHLLSRVKEIVPCFSLLQEAPYAYQFECTVLDEHGGRHSVPLAAVGLFEHAIKPTQDAQLIAASEIDTLVLHKDIQRIEVTLHIEGASPTDLAQNKWVLSIAQRTGARQNNPAETNFQSLPSQAINIPALSQMLVPEIGKRICSPTCVAMLVAQSSEKSVDPEQVAKIAYCAEHDLYGVWPWSVFAASRFGKLGVLKFFESWNSAKEMLDAGLPIIASIRYGKGEITGVALERETEKPQGHLVAVRGYQGDTVLVHDPAAPDNDSVARAYKHSEFLKVWLERSAMGYILF